ncbi:MAG: DNA repair protein RadC [Oscillospiraceae bacterium]|nr:DNA repair protein RadC [Oscillospiraceae bacterium]
MAVPEKTKPAKPLHSGHRERKKAQFREHGPDSFADHELLELLLFFSIPRADTNEIAHRLLNRFGGLQRVLDAPLKELEKVEGVGEHSALLLGLIAPVFQRALASGAEEGIVFTRPDHLQKYFEKLYTGEKYEVMYQLCLDARGRLLNSFKLNRGTPVSVGLDLREIVSNALASNAALVILAHNHPGGTAAASPSDIAGTEQVRTVLDAIDVTLTDHVILAGGGFFSFHNAGLL